MTNWKTTLAGIAAGALNLFATGASWKAILSSVAIALVGILAKDFNAPGTTIQARGDVVVEGGTSTVTTSGTATSNTGAKPQGGA
jgi:hypothetical protein